MLLKTMESSAFTIASSSPLSQFTPNDVVSPVTSIPPTQENTCLQCQQYRVIIAQLREQLFNK